MNNKVFAFHISWACPFCRLVSERKAAIDTSLVARAWIAEPARYELVSLLPALPMPSRIWESETVSFKITAVLKWLCLNCFLIFFVEISMSKFCDYWKCVLSSAKACWVRCVSIDSWKQWFHPLLFQTSLVLRYGP